MTRTNALLVVGCIMLALAIMVALELRQEVAEPAGQAVTGLINKTDPPIQTLTEAPKPGALVPLDQGTLRPDDAKPVVLPETTAPAPLGAPPSQVGALPSQVGALPIPVGALPIPVGAPPIPTDATEVASPKTPTAPSAVQQAAPAPNAAPKAEQTSAAMPAAMPATNAATVPPVVPPVVPETTPDVKADKKADAAADTKPADSNDDNGDTAKASPVRAIDTAGPAKVEKDQKAIVWTRLELADKSAIFRLSGAEKVEGKAFTLPDPDRYVVDLTGDWAMRLPAVPKNNFIKKIRVGKFGENTRMVLDLSGARNCQMVRINPTTLEFRIK